MVAKARTNAPIATFGATGFVGSAVVDVLGKRSRALTTPRVTTPARDLNGLRLHAETCDVIVNELAEQMMGCEGVIVAAGMPDATGPDSDAMFGANALAPLLIARAAARANCSTVIHISSAVVQGDASVLSSATMTQPLSPYGRSKALGERALLHASETVGTKVVIYRPPSVHAETRRISRVLTRIAASPIALVPTGRDQPTPQALLENVASAVVFLVDIPAPQQVVHHPWEGVTTTILLAYLGGRKPRRVPRPILRTVERSARSVCSAVPRLRPHARRLELLWFGQEQAPSWLTAAGWRPTAGRERWQEIGDKIRNG